MRLRQAKKVLQYWPLSRISTRQKAYRVAYKKLSKWRQERLWDGVRIMSRIKAGKFLSLIAAPMSETNEAKE